MFENERVVALRPSPIEFKKGAKPDNLPLEQPRRFKFAFNLKTAKAFGLTFPGDTARPRRRGDRVT
jgi:hypothetical protein